MPPGHNTVTRLLQQSRVGDKSAFDQLMPFVYQQLRKLAANCLRSERPDHTLPATALVHEAYLRLVDSNVAWEDRVHFYAVAARAMRHILVDHAALGRPAEAEPLLRNGEVALKTCPQAALRRRAAERWANFHTSLATSHAPPQHP